MSRQRFWTSQPSHRNAVDLFDGEWASDLAEVLPDMAHAGTPLFRQDPRPRQAAAALGTNGRFNGMSVLELGPLEGAHSHQLETLGAAQITAIEANAEAFLRCLVIKNVLSLDKTTFYLGDCVSFLKTTEQSFDVIFASGILYHMEDPVELIKLMSLRTDRVFIWSQYYDPSFRDAEGKKLVRRETWYSNDGFELPLFGLSNRGRFRRGFLGGNTATAHWLSLDGILAVLRGYGFDNIDIIANDSHGERGPAVTLAATRG